jgi:hypothetical protein
VPVGYITASVAEACATTEGWNRKDGQVTPGPRSPAVRSPSSVSTFHTNEACPWVGTQGWK